MSKLFKTELYKLLPFKTFWVIGGLYLLLLPLVFYMGSQLSFGVNGVDSDQMGFQKIYHFPYIWQNLTYLAGYFNILIGIFMIIHLTNEFSYRTWRQHVIDGLSRKEVVLGKYVTAIALSLFMALYTGLTALVFGNAYTPEGVDQSMFANAHYLVAYGLQTFGYLSLAILAGVLLQRSGLAIVLFILYVLLIEGIISMLIPVGIAEWLPLETIKSMVPFPFATSLEGANAGSIEALMERQGDPLFKGDFWAGLGYSVLFGVLAIGLMTKRDL